MDLLLMVAGLIATCIIAFLLMKRLTHSAERLSVLREEMARNDERLREQMQQLAALQNAQAEPDKNSEK